VTSASVVIPCSPYAPEVRDAIADYDAALPADVEIVLVSESSDAAAGAAAAELEQTMERVRTVAAAGAGWGRAVRAGLAAARGDVLCYANFARTTGDMLRTVIDLARSREQIVVKTNRRGQAGVLERLGSFAYNVECRLLYDLPAWDVNATPKAFTRTCELLLALRENGDLFDLEFALVSHRAGYPTVEVAMESIQRREGWPKAMFPKGAGLYIGAYRRRGSLGTAG
jgi:hypothetical protein